MPQKRTHVVLPDDLLAEIDTLVGQRGRSAFLVEVLREEVRRRHSFQILNDPEPAWKDEDHPELTGGADKWARKLCDEDVPRTNGGADSIFRILFGRGTAVD